MGVSGFTQRCRDVAAALEGEVFLWVALNTDGPHKPHDAFTYLDATHILRIANPARYEDPSAWMARVTPVLDQWVSVGIPPGALIVQHANEVDTTGVDLMSAWDIGVWSFWAHEYRDVLKARYPNLPLLAPPYTCVNTQYLTAEYVAPYEGVAVHCYWEKDNPGWRQGLDGGAAWEHALFGKPIWITEVGSNPQSAEEILAWAGEVNVPAVQGACIFIADGAASRWPQYDLTPEIAGAIRTGLVAQPQPDPPPAPPPHPTNSPLRFKGRSGSALAQMIVDGSNGGTSPFLDLVPDIIAVCAEWNLDEAAMIAWTTSENNNATNISDTLLAAHNGAGIKYVGQPRAHDGSQYRPPVLAPASEGSAPYCVFDSWADFFWTLARNIVTLLPDAYEAGDLNRIAWYYTTGRDDTSGGKHLKQRLYDQFSAYPNDGPTPSPQPAPTPNFTDLDNRMAEEAMRHVGETRMGPGEPLDDGNGSHSMANWCEAGAETVAAIVTGVRFRFPSAYVHYRSLLAGGHIDSDPDSAQPGEFDFWGPYGGDGHITIRGTDGLTYGTSVVPDVWIGRPVNYYGSYLGHAVSEAVLQVAADWQPKEDTDVIPNVTNAWDDGLLQAVWQSLKAPIYNPKTKKWGAAKTIVYNPQAGFFHEWVQRLRASQAIGVPCTQEVDWGDGRVTQTFTSGRMFEFNRNDGSLSVK